MGEEFLLLCASTCCSTVLFPAGFCECCCCKLPGTSVLFFVVFPISFITFALLFSFPPTGVVVTQIFFFPRLLGAEVRLPTLLRGRAGHTITLYDFFPDVFLVKLSFCSSYAVASIMERYELRLTENGQISLEPNLLSSAASLARMIILIPVVFKLHVDHERIRLVAFTSRKAVPAFWSQPPKPTWHRWNFTTR